MGNKHESTAVCGYCKAKNSISLYPTVDIFGNHFTINRCLECKAFFLAPRPDETMLAMAYDDTYYGEKEEKFSFPAIERLLDQFRMGRAKRLGALLKKGSHVLDIGCGNGKFLKYLLHFGDFRLHGIELEGNSARRAARNPEIHLKTGAIAHGDFPSASIDAVTMFHVFEHLTEPAHTLDIIDEILKPGGIFMLSFPNIDSFQSKIFKGNWLHLDPPRHLLFFTPKDFIDLMEKRGYQLKKSTWLSLEQNPFGFIQSFLNTFIHKREVLFERLKGNTVYAPEYGTASVLLQKVLFLALFPVFVLTDLFAALFKKNATMEFIFIKRLTK
jgi:SAM-dependent methyltransferase